MDNRRLSLLYHLQNLYNTSDFGTVDYQLSAYLIHHYKKIDKLNIYDVAEENHMSRATVRRFCQNLGYLNFKEMKQHFSEFDEGFRRYNDFYRTEDFLPTLRLQIRAMFEELETRLSEYELDKLASEIYSSDEVVIIASSTVASSIRVFQQTMAVLGKRITLVVDKENLIARLPLIGKDSLVIIFSISGLLAETFSEEIQLLQSKTYLFTLSRSPIFNQLVDKIYHFTAMDSLNTNDIIFYTYGITFVLDSIIHAFSKLNGGKSDGI